MNTASQHTKKKYDTEPVSLEENRRSLRRRDIFLALFPRSGSTWMRLLLSDVFLQTHGYATATELPIDRRFIIPDIYTHRLRGFRSAIKLPFRLIKTHERYENIIGKRWWHLWRPKVIYLFRHPADALCSFYHFEKRLTSKSENAPPASVDEMDQFCRKQITPWRDHVESYMHAKEKRPDRVLFISYESLHEQTVTRLQAALNFLGLGASKEMCAKSVENHLFEKQRQVPDIYKQFFRRGLRGSGQDELSASAFAYIEREGRPTYEKARRMEEIS